MLTSCMTRLINRLTRLTSDFHNYFFPSSFDFGDVGDDEFFFLIRLLLVQIRKFSQAPHPYINRPHLLQRHSTSIVAKVLVLSQTFFDVMSHIDGSDEK